MEEFSHLIKVAKHLLSPEGCPWDRAQTFQSMRQSILEEVYEVIEAIDLNSSAQMEEELGDLLFNIIFLCELAEKEQRFTLKKVIEHVTEKLIRRHPHVFKSDAKNMTDAEEVRQQWESIKKTEKKEQPREHLLDGIPKDLPALARAQKIYKKLSKASALPAEQTSFESLEEQAGDELWKMVQHFSKQKIEAEQALLKYLTQLEATIRVLQ